MQIKQKDRETYTPPVIEKISELSPKGDESQWFAYVAGSWYLLSIATKVAEGRYSRVWIAQTSAIKEEDLLTGQGNINMLGFKVDREGDDEIEVERHWGYEDVLKGEELRFLHAFLTTGTFEKIDKSAWM